MIFIVVKFKTKPECTERWPDLVADFTAGTRSEPGNMWFDWSRSLEDPTEYVLVEAFRAEEAGGAVHHPGRARRRRPPRARCRSRGLMLARAIAETQRQPAARRASRRAHCRGGSRNITGGIQRGCDGRRRRR